LSGGGIANRRAVDLSTRRGLVAAENDGDGCYVVENGSSSWKKRRDGLTVACTILQMASGAN